MDRLAQTTSELEPPELEVFDLTSTDPSLPRFVFITHLASNEWQVGPRSQRGTCGIRTDETLGTLATLPHRDDGRSPLHGFWTLYLLASV